EAAGQQASRRAFAQALGLRAVGRLLMRRPTLIGEKAMSFLAMLKSLVRGTKRRASWRPSARARLLVEVLENRNLPSSIQGTIYNDANANGVKDVGEAGVAGWTVFLDLNRNGALDSSEPTAVTDANGQYNLDTTAHP